MASTTKIEVQVRPGGPPSRGRAGFRFSQGGWSTVEVDAGQRDKIENDPYLVVRRVKRGSKADGSGEGELAQGEAPADDEAN